MHHGATGEIKVFAEETSLHTMWARGVYTSSSPRVVNRRQKRKLNRSTNAPEIRAGVMTANMPWTGECQSREFEAVLGVAEVLQQCIAEEVADDGIHGAGVTNGEAESNADQDQFCDDHRVEHIATLDKAAIEEGKAWGHQQHQGGANQDQCVVCSGAAIGGMGG